MLRSPFLIATPVLGLQGPTDSNHSHVKAHTLLMHTGVGEKRCGYGSNAEDFRHPWQREDVVDQVPPTLPPPNMGKYDPVMPEPMSHHGLQGLETVHHFTQDR